MSPVSRTGIPATTGKADAAADTGSAIAATTEGTPRQRRGLRNQEKNAGMLEPKAEGRIDKNDYIRRVCPQSNNELALMKEVTDYRLERFLFRILAHCVPNIIRCTYNRPCAFTGTSH